MFTADAVMFELQRKAHAQLLAAERFRTPVSREPTRK